MMPAVLTKYACGVEYLGSHYKGWQSQDSQETIQDQIESALSNVANEKLRIYSAGRTDSGVHASILIYHLISAFSGLKLLTKNLMQDTQLFLEPIFILLIIKNLMYSATKDPFLLDKS